MDPGGNQPSDERVENSPLARGQSSRQHTPGGSRPRKGHPAPSRAPSLPRRSFPSATGNSAGAGAPIAGSTIPVAEFPTLRERSGAPRRHPGRVFPGRVVPGGIFPGGIARRQPNKRWHQWPNSSRSRSNSGLSLDLRTSCDADPNATRIRSCRHPQVARNDLSVARELGGLGPSHSKLIGAEPRV